MSETDLNTELAALREDKARLDFWLRTGVREVGNLGWSIRAYGSREQIDAARRTEETDA